MYSKEKEILNDNINPTDKIFIFDTTLRDGEQTPGVALTVDEKIQIAQKLNNLGVDKIEVGFPASSKGEIESSKRIVSMDLDSTLVGLSRSLKKDIDSILDSNLEYVHSFIGTSPLHRDYKLKMSPEEIIETAVDAIEYAKDHGLTVEFSAEDATRTERDFLFEVYSSVIDAGADFLDVPDTVGVLTPVFTRDLITDIKNNFKTPISVHFHNDFGLATANTLTAIGKTPTDIDQIISRTITYVNNDTVTAIGTNAFANCSSLETCILPNATSDVGGSAFNSCISLNTVELPKVTALQGNAFYGCASLVEITLPAIINIETRAFRNCYSLTKLVLPGNRVVSLNADDVFGNTPIASGTGYVYVHPDRLSSYKSMTNWDAIKNQIKSIEELS